ncbi:B12-binding domain-containing radical SAM protein [Campylobacterota bacterium]|nr:B12-binding domain-containing radical SAM protein [Campylobacterota bacterium]
MRLTIIHPAIGHRKGERYIRTWQMEPLPAATVAGLVPSGIEVRFYDDRMEQIPFDEPTDAVAISIETYTARRAYQIASEYRRRRVPVIFGGFHATLCPDEAARYAEAVVIGEAEGVFAHLIDDLRHGTLQKLYRSDTQPDLSLIRVDRSIFTGKSSYLPIRLVETGRGCRFPCDFCSVQTFFEQRRRSRPIADALREIEALKATAKLLFFVDDNFAGDIAWAKLFLSELARLKVRWVTQISIDAAHDAEFLALLEQSGCQAVLIGFESLNSANLAAMNKRFNTMRGGYTTALDNLRRYHIRVYGTFVFGYEHDTIASFDEAVEFAIDQQMYIAAFNHLTPFPGTPLYQRLERERRLRYDAWWLDEGYRYNAVPFLPAHLTPEAITDNCVRARRRFYGLASIVRRGFAPINRGNGFIWRNFWSINLLQRWDVSGRNGYPLGDETWHGELIEAVR